MRGGVMSGYCEMGSPERATAPTITVTMEMTIATMGRRMKKFPIGYLAGEGEAEDAPPMLAAAGGGPACGGGGAGSGGASAALPGLPAPTFLAPSSITLFAPLT